MTQEYVIEQVTADRRGYQVRVTYYAYAVLDSDGREILAYHWHPTSVSPIAYPHLHLSSRIRPIDIGPDADPVALADMHLPTGPITLEDIVRLLITEFAIAPRREHWDDILAEGG